MHRYTSLRRQAGLTMIGWMVVIAIAVFFVILGIKLVPPYLEHYSLRNVLDEVARDPQMRTKSPRQLRKLIKKRFKINGVYEFDPEDITISKNKDTGGYEVSLDYIVEEPMVYNISALIAFDYEVRF